jgi:hypothetical protein
MPKLWSAICSLGLEFRVLVSGIGDMPKSIIAVGGHQCVRVKRELERANGGEREGGSAHARASEREKMTYTTWRAST